MKGYFNNLRPFERRLVVGVGVMVFIVLNFAFVFPHFSDWGKMKERKAKAEDTLQKFLSELQQTNQIGREIAKLENQGQGVPPEDQVSEFARTVQVLASQYHVNVLNLNRPTERSTPFFVEVSLPLQLAAREEDLVDFLYNLGVTNSLIRVRGLNVQPDKPARQNLNVNVTVVASYQKKAPARPSAPSAQPVAAPATKATPIAK
jgi:Tfp pilus assembly protein PilO